MDSGILREGISKFIREEVERSGRNGIVLSFGRGPGPAVVLRLAEDALGKGSVLALLMPERNTTPMELMEAERYLQKSEIRYRLINIDQIVESFKRALAKEDERAMENLRPRIRMCLLYYFANSENLLVAGTSTKSQVSLGELTKYGDGAADLLPLADLYESEVSKLAGSLGVSRPAPGKAQGGIPQKRLDGILQNLDLGKTATEASRDSGATLEEAKQVRVKQEKNRHKRLLPPYFRISNRGHASPISIGAGALCLIISVYLAKAAFAGNLPGQNALKVLSVALMACSALALLPI